MNIKRLAGEMRYEARMAYRRYKVKGLFNYFLSRIDLTLRLPFALAKPITLNISIIEGLCNLSCKICHRFAPGYGRKLSFENFKKIGYCLMSVPVLVQISIHNFRSELKLLKIELKYV